MTHGFKKIILYLPEAFVWNVILTKKSLDSSKAAIG